MTNPRRYCLRPYPGDSQFWQVWDRLNHCELAWFPSRSGAATYLLSLVNPPLTAPFDLISNQSKLSA